MNPDDWRKLVGSRLVRREVGSSWLRPRKLGGSRLEWRELVGSGLPSMLQLKVVR